MFQAICIAKLEVHKFRNENKNKIISVTHLENVNTSDKETQIDHISMLKEYDLIHYQQQHPDQFRPYGI